MSDPSTEFVADDMFFKACHLRGVDPHELEHVPFTKFKEKDVPEEVAAVRFNGYQERRFRKLCLVMQTRQELLSTQSSTSPQRSHLTTSTNNKHAPTSASGTSPTSQTNMTTSTVVENVVDISRRKFTYYKQRAQMREEAAKRRKALEDKLIAEMDEKRKEIEQSDHILEEQKEVLAKHNNHAQALRASEEDKARMERRQKEIDEILAANKQREYMDARLSHVRKQLELKKVKQAKTTKEIQEQREIKLAEIRQAEREKIQQAWDKSLKKHEERRLNAVVSKFMVNERMLQRGDDDDDHIQSVINRAREIEEHNRQLKLAMLQDKEKHSAAYLEALREIKRAPKKEDTITRCHRALEAHEDVQQKTLQHRLHVMQIEETKLARSEQRRALDRLVLKEMLANNSERRVETARRVRREDAAKREEMRISIDKKRSELEQKMNEKSMIVQKIRLEILSASGEHDVQVNNKGKVPRQPKQPSTSHGQRPRPPPTAPPQETTTETRTDVELSPPQTVST